MYITNLYKELKIWQKIRKIAKAEKQRLNDNGFRIDWVGRIYTVINLPEEVVSAPISQEGYVLMQLRQHDKLFLDLGIADYVSPEFSPIPDTDSFLLVLSADREYFKLWPLIKSLGKTILLLVFIRVLYVMLSSYNEKISELWNQMINLIF
tara:strand:- start:660 stop:1112 length:453 start_codon:yes stop_codon:yes gene_type:complete